ncbi:DNA-binding response regulator [Salipaludibacillus neizhouensis]|uniref:DNA-binding response regulator n=1 Tax=Salipaludibacillus neizhouensis TaxID=885475 RepID=A0A3A9KAN7_9BACI|nr:response regulator [Salipaludibacillus neizhouensis]RKL66643.1 DNA-binding response regulator [Salipaludibacillus neizhouensis]
MKKWKVLIADDEFIIRDGIRSSVDWEKYNMEVIGEAEDGEEAVELAITHQIDILLIDINMPIMNGFIAMKQLKEQLPNCKMLVISGYDEFSYAQEAIRLHVEDYLLKPVNPEKLQILLMEIKEKLDIEVNKEVYLKQAASQIKKNQAQMKRRFFQDWIERNLSSDEIKEQLHFIDLPVSSPKQYMVIRWPEYHQNQTYMQENDRQIFLFAIENIVEEKLAAEMSAVFRDQSNLFNVCLWETVDNDQMKEIEEAILKYLKIKVYWHIEDVDVDDLTNLYKTYEMCKLKVDKQIRVSPIVKEAQLYVQQNYQDSSLTLERVAEQLHVSSVYLSRMMKQELAISYVGLLKQMRINKATDLLKTTDMSIRAIAEEVGFDSQHYFSTTFKKMVGVSPNQFKK